MSQTSQKLTISANGSVHTFVIPEFIYPTAARLKDDFVSALPTNDNSAYSTADLIYGFLEYLLLTSEGSAEPTDAKILQCLGLVVADFETNCLGDDDIHMYATKAGYGPKAVTTYYAAKMAINKPIEFHESPLLKAVTNGEASVLLTFGGQGLTDNCIAELRDIYNLYKPIVGDFVPMMCEKLRALASSHPSGAKAYPQGLDVMKWINNVDLVPDADYIRSAAVSMPVIGIIQLTNFAAAAKSLGMSPGQFRQYFAGITGHSQGIVTAVAISSVSDWESFYVASIKALNLLFSIGLRGVEKCTTTALDSDIVSDAQRRNLGRPSPMLFVGSIPEVQLQEMIDDVNSKRLHEERIEIALINAPDRIIVAGPAKSLYDFAVSCQNAHNDVLSQFLDVSTPYHSSHLQGATQQVLCDIAACGDTVELTGDSLRTPVFDTFDGSNLQEFGSKSIIPRVIELVNDFKVNWEIATELETSHVVDFGPGESFGIGRSILRLKKDSGLRVILFGCFNGDMCGNTGPEVSFKHALYCEPYSDFSQKLKI